MQESQEEICTCPTCTVSQLCLKNSGFHLTLTFIGTQASYEVLYGEYMVKAGKGREPPDKSTAAIMESILQVRYQSGGWISI